MRFSLAALVVLSATQLARAQDCADASDQSTMNQCALSGWEAADADLNQAYQMAIDVMDTIDADLPEDLVGGAKTLRDAQRAWITFRDKACEAEGFLMRGGSAEPLIVYGCMQRLTEQRTNALAELAGQY